MILVIQRVLKAKVTVNNVITGQINKGLLILQGISPEDRDNDINWLVNKTINMRIFSDQQGLMNLSVQDIKGEILVVSQFTLLASTKKGNRPSFIKAAKPDIAQPMYEAFVDELRKKSSLLVETGEFGGDMQIDLVNDGPVTLIIDSKVRN